MTKVVMVIDEARRDVGREAIASAGAKALGTDARVLVAPFAELPDSDAWVVFADDLDAYTADSRFASRAERTLILNAPRADVLDLLEKHGLGGAIECDDPDGWSGPARMFVRKEAVDRDRGEIVGGRGRESERYALWRASDVESLAELVSKYARSCIEFTHRHDELVITAKEARAHGLPPIGIRFIVGRTHMFPQPFPEPGYYVSMISPPGGGPGFSVIDAGGSTLAEIVQRESAATRNAFRAFAPEDVELAGRKHPAVACVIGDGLFRYAACYVLADRLLFRFTCRWPSGDPTAASVLAQASLAIIARSLQISG